jgi:hypothetical protein
MESPSRLRYSGKCPFPPHVISSGGSMLYDSTAQNRYSYDESRNLPCVREYRALRTGVSVVTPSQAFFPEISRLSLTYYFESILIPTLTTARDDGKGMESPSRLRYSVKCPFPPQVISSGGSMLYRSTVKNRYSFEESRNLSCGREYTL